MTKDNLPQLIVIVSSLILALAFFSDYAVNKGSIHRVALETFIFGIFAIVCLCISQHSSLNHVLTTSTKILGYIFLGYFILFYLGFLLYPLIEKGTVFFLKELLSSTIFRLSTAIIFIISIIAIIRLSIKLAS